jgi:hypothetical protein
MIEKLKKSIAESRSLIIESQRFIRREEFTFENNKLFYREAMRALERIKMAVPDNMNPARADSPHR